MSINCFVKSDDQKKQFPMVFALMSRRRKTDYVQVLQAIIDRLENPAVEGFVLDFEIAAWEAVRQLFPGIEIKGCVFHWCQAVYRKIKEIGLSTAYRKDKPTRRYLQQYLALPFLPESHIAPTHESLAPKANSEKLKEFVDYVENQWISNDKFPVSQWTIFEHSVRTNNHIEAWHRRLNQKAGQRLSFYKLVPVLKQEADYVEINVCARDLETEVRSKYTAIDKALEEAWRQYRTREIKTTEFLKKVASIYKLGK